MRHFHKSSKHSSSARLRRACCETLERRTLLDAQVVETHQEGSYGWQLQWTVPAWIEEYPGYEGAIVGNGEDGGSGDIVFAPQTYYPVLPTELSNNHYSVTAYCGWQRFDLGAADYSMALLPPDSLWASVSDSSTVVLHWHQNSLVTSNVQVLMQTDGGEWTLTPAETDDELAIVSGLHPGSSYGFMVQAMTQDGAITSEPCDPVALALDVDPSIEAPSNLVLYTGATGGPTLHWADNSSDENGFRIEISSNGGPFADVGTVAANHTQFPLPWPLGEEVQYQFRVRAMVDPLLSPASDPALVYSAPLAAPSELTATAVGTSAINLFWMDNSNVEIGYEIWRSDAGGAYTLIDTTTANDGQGPMAYQATEPTPGTAYSFRIRAKSATQYSVFSSRDTATTLYAPRSVAIVNGGFEADVLQPGTGHSPIAGWTISGVGASAEALYSHGSSPWNVDAAEGHNIAWLMMDESTESDHDALLTQQLQEVLQPNTSYELRVMMGAPEDSHGGEIELLAGGVALPLTWDSGASWGLDHMGEAVLSFHSSSNTAHLGQPLSIRLTAFAGNPIPTPSLHFGFDDVRLLATPDASEQAPHGGTPWAAPGVIEFENFDDGGENISWHDTTGGNTGGYYRRNVDADVDIARDDTGGYDVGWTKAGEWLSYTIDVPTADTYDLTSYVASPSGSDPQDLGAFHWTLDGNIIYDGSTNEWELSVPPTGGYYSYQPVPITGVYLSAGPHVLRLWLDTNGSNANGWNSVANFNYFTITTDGASLSTPTPTDANAPYPNRVDLSWTDDNTNESFFEIQRSSDNGSTWPTTFTPLRANTKFFADTTALANTSYVYRIRATGSGMQSTWVNFTSVTTPADLSDLPIKINFQVDRTIPEPGYLPDSGELFGNRNSGLQYGWNMDETIQDRERGINPDRKLDTLVQFRQGATWTIQPPPSADGNYDVTIGIGDPLYASTYTLNVNGISFWNAVYLPKNAPQSRTLMVHAGNDGMIVLDQGSAANQAARINYIIIEPASNPPPPGTPQVWIEPKNAQGVVDNVASEPGTDTAWFTVYRDNTDPTPLVVQFDIAGSASPSDYTPDLSAGQVTIPGGLSSYSFEITPVDNLVAEPAETLTLQLRDGGSSYVRGTPASATATIFDNDSGQEIVIGDIGGDFTPQLMDYAIVSDSYSIPAMSVGGTFSQLFVGAPDDPDQPYVNGVDYYARVNGTSGDIDVTFVRPGPYLVDAVRTAGGGAQDDEFVEVFSNCSPTLKSPADRILGGKSKKIPLPTADLNSRP